MKKTILIPSLLLSFILGTSYGQKYIDYTKELSNISGHLVIDGNTLQSKMNTRGQIIITGHNMVLNDRSSFMFNNVIIQLTGSIFVKGKTRPGLIDSYIFCKNSGALKSDKIIEIKKFDKVEVRRVAYIESLKGNPEISIYAADGHRVFKGRKSDTEDFHLPISTYDVKVTGIGFKDRLLFINK